MIAIPMPDFWWPLVRVWRNHPANRGGFGTNHVITPGEHQRWYYALPDHDRQYMLMDKGWPVATFGLVRLDDVRTELTRVCVDPDLHRCGYGRASCRLAAERAQQEFRAQLLCLRVLRSNLAAHGCYLQVGFGESDPPMTLAAEYLWMQKVLLCH